MIEVFKTGWIQTQENGAYKDVAPKTLAGLVYVDVGQTQTVRDMLYSISNNSKNAQTLPAYSPNADTSAAPDSTVQAQLDALYTLYRSLLPTVN